MVNKVVFNPIENFAIGGIVGIIYGKEFKNTKHKNSNGNFC